MTSYKVTKALFRLTNGCAIIAPSWFGNGIALVRRNPQTTYHKVSTTGEALKELLAADTLSGAVREMTDAQVERVAPSGSLLTYRRTPWIYHVQPKHEAWKFVADDGSHLYLNRTLVEMFDLVTIWSDGTACVSCLNAETLEEASVILAKHPSPTD